MSVVDRVSRRWAPNTLWTGVLGLGLALAPIHSDTLVRLATNSDGETVFFLPAFGYILILMGAGLFLVRKWDEVRAAGWGERQVAVPLLLLALSMAVSGLVNGESLGDKIAPAGMGVGLFALYLVSRVLGGRVFWAMAPVAAVVAVTVIVNGLVWRGQYTGGLITNYQASVGFMVFAVLVSRGRVRLWLLALVVPAALLTGSLEGLFILGVLGLFLVARHDVPIWGIAAVGAIGLAVILWGVLGYLGPLYNHNSNLSTLGDVATGQADVDAGTMKTLTSGRWERITAAVMDMSIFGHGYALSPVTGQATAAGIEVLEQDTGKVVRIVHVVPLAVLDQVGLLGMLAWLWVVVGCLFRTSWKYAWVGVLAMSVWDHYLWSQMAPWVWALAGVSASVSPQETRDWLFRPEPVAETEI